MIAYIIQDRLITFAIATWTAFILVGCYNLVVNSKWYVRQKRLKMAARNLLDDVRRRHPYEDLTCPFMIALDDALND